MKKPLAILTTTIAAALGILFLAACANPFINPRERDNPAGEGRGLVRIETGAGPARTALPGAVFDHYEYSFSHEGIPVGAIAPLTAGGDEFELEPGSWEVTVEAYAGTENDTLAAQGSGSFSVNLGEETKVTVKLSPIVSSGTGMLNYALAYPDGAVVSSFTLTLLAGEEDINLLEDAVSGSGSLAGTITAPSGYYLARAFMQKNGIAAGKNEVVHIYNNLTTNLELKFVDDNFKAIVVVSSADSGPGTLREALTGVMSEDGVAGATIRIDLPEGDRVISLRTVLQPITKSITIEGNGATLTQFNVPASNTSQLLYINATTAEVRISRLHFTGGRAWSYGGAIRNTGKLTLESCIFSDNQTTAVAGYGGAIYSAGISDSLAISGCTFYGNTAGTTGGFGGAVYVASGSAILTGNVLWGNSAAEHSVVYGAVTVASGGFNVSDKADGTDNTTGSGWEFKDGDKQTSSLPVSYISFRPLSGGAALNVITIKPEGYPALDFYGVPIPGMNAAAGAAQTATTGIGFVLDYAPQGPGTVNVTGGTVDRDGFASSSVTLTAQDVVNGVFRYWIVDGDKHGEPSNTLTLTMDKDTAVRAVFYIVATSTASSGPGTLREALSDVISGGGGIVLPEGQTITLNTSLPDIAKSFVLEGNGATLTQSGFAESTTSQLLRISDYGGPHDIHISRLHFRGGRTTAYGGAIYNSQGTLTLESCIFSDNRTRYNGGGAIHTAGNTSSLTVSGCTFYGNVVTSAGGGAIYYYNGQMTLTGNIFWGNTAAQDNVISGVGVVSGGFNVSDKADGADAASGSGWTFTNGDKQALFLPVSPVSFRPIGGGEALNVIDTRPEGYPTKDFYGVNIPGTNAAAGAAQTAAAGSGYFLDYAPQGPGTVSIVGGNVDSNGFAGSSVTLAASENANGAFRYWAINDGTERRESTNPLSLNVTGNTIVRAMFYTKVTSAADSGPGTLREILPVIGAGEGIVLPAGQTITLTSALPRITKSLVIEGNGATLTKSGIASNLLYIEGLYNSVRISRLHFKGARANDFVGGAINNVDSLLTLESCIFSDNQTNSYGGAIHSSAALTISGCTFYGNSAGYGYGGAIRISSGAATLTGNVFWENGPYYVVYGSVTSGGFNVSDKESGFGSGWDFANGDKQVSLPISPVSFKPINGGEAIGIITTRPPGYPERDFYGVDIPAENAAAGAIQTATAEVGYFLDYGSTGPGTVSAEGLDIDEEGLLSSNSVVTLTAHANNNNVAFMHWIVDGAEAEEQSPPHQLAVTMDDHKTVRAVFYFAVTNVSDDDESGTLREALTNAGDGDGIVLPAGQTITLMSALPRITKSLVIEGNGATLTQNGFTESTTSQLLYINSTTAEVRISRLHFMGGRATEYGAAIYNSNSQGTLTLESCIFSDNRTSRATANGGAVYIGSSYYPTIISGCTFYENTAGTTGGRGGAVYISSSSTGVILTGNVFWGNTANQRSVVYGGSLTSGGYNVSDKESGTNNTTGSGWTFINNDTPLSDVSFDANLRPSHSGLPAIPSPPVGNPDLFPLRYFDGTLRGSTPGAMPAQ